MYERNNEKKCSYQIIIIKRGKKVLINMNRKINIFKINNILIFNDLK